MTERHIEKLGRYLREVRGLRGWSLHKTAREAKMSPAYIQKLERAQVAAPSPHKLQALARAYEISYDELMRLAGYGAPDVSAESAPTQVLAQALLAEDLTEEEVQELASYLRWRRDEKRRRAS